MCVECRTIRGVALVVVFFFQAEDGIRDVAVTGVQTCALPIYGTFWSDDEMIRLGLSRKRARDIGHLPQSGSGGMLEWLEKRSEERRVGKEGRSRWAPYH